MNASDFLKTHRALISDADVATRRCLFVTMTAPSAMRPMRAGKANPEYVDSTPADAQAYLRATWARARATLFRQGVCTFGVRIVEPHRDATPHWHVVLWVQGENAKNAEVCLRSMLGRNVACQVVNNEGLVDYVGKYLGKHSESVVSQPVRAWAACWGIRLYGFFGIWPKGGAA